MKQNFVAPELNKMAFNCPHCGAYSHQIWHTVVTREGGGWHESKELRLSVCVHCKRRAVWRTEHLLFPAAHSTAAPHPEMPESVRSDYLEAQEVFARSPRSSAALLRLAVQKLGMELGEPGRNLSDDIANLVKKGLPVKVQQSLDVVRVVGNNQVHPGTLDVRDNPEIAAAIFGLVNMIVEIMIAQPKHIQALYEKLPDEARAAIAKRDGKAGS